MDTTCICQTIFIEVEMSDTNTDYLEPRLYYGKVLSCNCYLILKERVVI